MLDGVERGHDKALLRFVMRWQAHERSDVAVVPLTLAP